MKKNKTTIIMILFFFAGLLILLYPAVSNYFNEKVQSKAIANYETLLEKYSNEDYDNLFNEAYEYNKKLSELDSPLIFYKKIPGYNKILNIKNDGMIGYITIDKINVELPIYHDTTESVLSQSVGHLKGSSFPVGGVGTHSVLSAHRGLPSSKLFTDLDRMEIGDIFTIDILNQKLTYEVDNITIVKPDEIENLKIYADKDYVTLLTCTPYGINTHRLLVRGIRIENIVKPKYITTEAFKISTLIVTPIVALPIIFILLLIVAFKPIKKNKKWKEKYIYPSKTKKEVGGNIYEKQKN